MRIELTHKGFADLSLTTWVPRHPSEIIAKLRKTVSQARVLPLTASLQRRFLLPAKILPPLPEESD